VLVKEKAMKILKLMNVLVLASSPRSRPTTKERSRP
jgi:hypothetical protein